jgi:predicted transcriptional regulator
MELLDIALKMHEAGCTRKQITKVTGLSYIALRHHVSLRPSDYPASFYITRLKQGRTVNDIAEELNVTPMSVYRQLKQKNVSIHLYQELSRREL